MRNKIAIFLVVLFACIGSPVQAAIDSSGLEIAVAGDFTGEVGLEKDSEATDDFRAREVELIFFGPIDHQFDGLVSAAAHYESGETLFELHELTIGSSKLIPRSRFKLGQFFLGVGRLNRFHRHDWPFISAPKVHLEFFDAEGVIDRGGEFSMLPPLPFYLDITVGITSGWTYGHTHVEGEKPIMPTHYFRTSTFLEYDAISGMEIGLNYLRRKAANKTDTRLTGIDWVSKSRHEKYVRYLVQGELWNRQVTTEAGANEQTVGFYVYPQYGFNSELYLGVRFDGYSVLSRKNIFGEKESNFAQSIVPTLTYSSSEFAKFRLAYNQSSETVKGEEVSSDKSLEFQATFILGAHPAHDF